MFPSRMFARLSRFSCLALLGSLTPGGTWGAAQQTCMSAMPMNGPMKMDGMETVPAPETLPAPIHMTGIGNSHITIKATPEAQTWFDQGLSLQHDFWDYESIKAFEQAVRVDPNCAMCFWGLAHAEGSRGNSQSLYAKKALAEAVRLKKHASGSDKLYIEAAEADAKAKEGDSAPGIAAYRKLVKKYPQDIEARIFLAGSLEDGYDDKGEPKPGTKEAIALLEGVLKEAPNDSAANHYWIHAMEPSNHPDRAIASAALLASLAPTSGHMVHMPGHIYYRLGDYANADRWFAASTEADEKYMREQKVGPDDDWNYVHNMMYGIANLIEQGRLQDADALSDKLSGARGTISATLYVWSARDQMARVSNRLPVALRLGDWDGVLALLDHAPVGDGEKTANLHFLATELRDFATGMRALDANDVNAARAASARLDAGLWRQSQHEPGKKPEEPKKDAPPTVAVNPDADASAITKEFRIASLELQAGVLAAEGSLEPAKKLYTQAAAAEKKLGYHEPPFYIRPVAETEAAALLKARDYAGAKTAYEAALVERPRSGFELYGLAHTKELAGDSAGAKAGYEAFLQAWPSADASLPEVEHAKTWVGATVEASTTPPTQR